MKTRWKIAVAIFAAWLVFGILLAQQIYALRTGNNESTSWLHALFYELVYCSAWALMTPLVLYMGHRFPLEGRKLWHHIFIHLITALVLAAVAQTTEVAVLTAFHFTWFPQPSLASLGRSIASTLDYGAILYWIVALAAHFVEYLQRYHQEQSIKAQLETQLAEAQLQALKMQMHPHFLFNALNSISELIHEDPQAAELLVIRLSELLRTFLSSAESHETELFQEADFLRRYLEIQQIRFEERLHFKLDLHPETLAASVPTLILQPLVENAIRHGIRNRETGGVVEIVSETDGTRLILRVSDNGTGESSALPSNFHEGTGLRNTRRRLERLYGRNQEFSIKVLPAGGVQASISIPFTLAKPSVQQVAHEYAYR